MHEVVHGLASGVARRATPHGHLRGSAAGTLGALSQGMLDAVTAQDLIKPHMPVVCSENGQFATVDHIEGHGSIKLAKDDKGQHHYIPLEWVTSVDDKVHIDRPGKEAMQQWTTNPPRE